MDFSLISLLLSNIALYYFAKTSGWSISNVLLVYILQSLIIGVFHIVRILQLKNFSVSGVEINGVPMKISGTSEAAKRIQKLSVAGFFALHYGFFHLIYTIFILTKMFGNFNDIPGIIIATGIFFVNHLISFFMHAEKSSKKVNLATYMFAPYVRVVPMHMTIIFGLVFHAPLEIFVFIKIVADVAFHFIEHRIAKNDS